MTEPEKQRRRVIRSYVLRDGRMTEGQQRAFDAHWDRWGLRHSDGVVDFTRSFGRHAPVTLEIGFGMGQSLLRMAAAAPERNFIGIEVHKPGVGRLLHGMDEQAVHNIRVFRHDAVEVLRDCIESASLDTVQIYFPDPWHKKRHHKRRLINDAFASGLAEKMKSGALLHLATDWENYAEQMMEVLSASDHFDNTCPAGEFAPRPEYRPVTKFEQRGERLGHGVWDLLFTRRGDTIA